MNLLLNIKKPKPVYLILLLALLQFTIAVFTHSLSFTHEEAMWQYIGRNWITNGLAPYEGGIDNKSPLIFYIFGISDKLFGNVTWFPRFMGTLIQSAGIWYLYRIVKLIVNKEAAYLTTLIYGLSVTWLITGGRYVSFTETYAVALLLGSYFYVLRDERKTDLLLSGVLTIAAISFRITVLAGCIPLFFLVIKKRRKCIPWLLGLTIAIILYGFWLYVQKISINELWFHSIRDNFNSGGILSLNPELKWRNFKEAFLLSPLILFYPLWALFLFKIRKPNFITLWLACEFAGILFLGSFARNHLKQLLPPLCAVSGIAAYWLWANKYLAQQYIYILALLIFFPKTMEPLYGAKNLYRPMPDKSAILCDTPFTQPDPYQLRLLGKWLKENTSSTEKIYIAGMGAQVQAYSERQSPTVYFNVTQTFSAKLRLFADLESTKPKWVLVPRFKAYTDFVDKQISDHIYELINREYILQECRYGYQIYMRN